MRIAFLIIALSIFTQCKGQIDKVLHFQVGMAIGQLTFPMKPKKSLIVSITAATLIATAKEYRDYRTYGKFDKYDILATTSGALIGSLTTTLIKRLINF